MGNPIEVGKSHLRVARPTDDLAAVVRFYRDALGFKVVVEFEGHEGFDGVILGHKGAGYHLEFTTQKGHTVGRSPTPEHALAFFMPDKETWKAAVARLESAGHKSVPAYNPYWDTMGLTFEDPDGYRVVLVKGPWWAG